MEIFAISGIVNAVVAASFGILVFSKNWRGREQRLFFILTLFLAAWGLCYSRWQLATDEASALFWVRTLAGVSVFIPVGFLHWILANLNKSTKFVPIFYAGAVLAASLSYTNLLVESVGPILSFSYWPKAGIVYTICIFIAYAGMVLYAIFSLVYALLKSKDKRTRGRLLYVLSGAVLGFGGGATNFPLWYGIPIPPYGTFLVAAFPFLLGYSIIRHRLFDLKTIAAEIITFFILIILLVQTALATTTLEFSLRAIFLAFVAVLGFLLTRSVYREVEAREEIEKLAKQLETANGRLKELDQLKSEFLSLATHQLRSPLTAIKGYASLLTEGSYGSLSEGAKEAAGRIFQSSQSLAKVVEDFLNVSRIEQGRMQYNFEEEDVEEVLGSVVAELKPNIVRSGLRFSYKPVGGPFRSRVDELKLRQVFGNLIDNSLKYTPSGFVEVELSRAQDKILLGVKDSGVGMDKDTLSKLFEKFSRAKDASKTNTEGTGLGLYLAREITSAHGGRLWAESPGRGRGSTFYVELPAL